MIYQWKPGARISANPDSAAKVLNELAKENRLNAESLVEASRPEDAPLHGEFDWNDEIAACEWRKHQARHIISSIVMIEEKKANEPVRAFFNITETSGNYESIQTIMQTQDGIEALKKRCLKELIAFKQKYRAVIALIDAGENIDAVQTRLEEAL